jgi:hypothetical protein
MGRRISRAIDRWPQDRLVIRVNWPRVAFALLWASWPILVVLGIQGASDRRNQQPASGASSTATEVSSARKADSSSTLQLVEEPVSQGTDGRLPLGIFVRGPSELASTAAVEIIDLPNEWALSAGRPFGYRWRIPSAQLSGAAILPSLGFSGAVDLAVELRLADDSLVERRSVRRVVTGQELAIEKTMENRLLLIKAEGFLAVGDISAARLLLERAAGAGNAAAALLIAETYEECPLRSNCPAPDPPKAQIWYERAAILGSAEARRRLDRLPRDEPRGDHPRSTRADQPRTDVNFTRR